MRVWIRDREEYGTSFAFACDFDAIQQVLWQSQRNCLRRRMCDQRAVYGKPGRRYGPRDGERVDVAIAGGALESDCGLAGKPSGSLERARPLMDSSMLLICAADERNVQPWSTPRPGGGAVVMLTGKTNRGKHGD